MTGRKTSTKPTRIWKFGARLQTREVACAILLRKCEYYNLLVEIERARHARYVAIRARYAPALATLDEQWACLHDQLLDLYREAKRERQEHWRESGGEKLRILPPEYEARKEELGRAKQTISDQAKPLRASFARLLDPARSEYQRRTKQRAGDAGPRTKGRVNAEVLVEMLDEDPWHPAWKEIARSDELAHDLRLHARAHCRLASGTYLDVEAAFARAKQDSAPGPPRFKRAELRGKIQVQLRGTAWSAIGHSERLQIGIVPPRGADPSARSNIRLVTLDQSVGDERLVVSALCRLHRLPPGDADVKWLALFVRPDGCELQLTLEHESFAEPKRPSGVERPVHVALGWAHSELGLRVARLLRGAKVIDEIHCPERIIRQKAYAEAVEAIGDQLRGRTLRTLRTVLYLTGHRITNWRALESDRYRAWLRRQCEQFARHVLGGEAGVRARWRKWQRDRHARGSDLYASLRELRARRPPREALAWWCWIWARKDQHLEQLASNSRRRFRNRRDAHYRAEAIRIANVSRAHRSTATRSPDSKSWNRSRCPAPTYMTGHSLNCMRRRQVASGRSCSM